MATVENLYQSFGVLADAKDKAGETTVLEAQDEGLKTGGNHLNSYISLKRTLMQITMQHSLKQHKDEYLVILGATKGGSSEKRLASQFIARFFKYFPDLAFQAINALFDLCEDDDAMIRKTAVKDLPSLCKAIPDHVSKIAEALTQLLQWDEPSELNLVQSSLMTLFNIRAKDTLKGIFTQILAEDVDDQVREKAIKFLTMKLKTLPDDLLDKDAEEHIVSECRKVLQDVTKDEFISIMNLLKSLKVMGTVQGRQQLVEIVVELAELDQDFKPSDPDVVDKFIQCVKQAMPLFSKNVHSKAFMNYMCENVMPVLSELTTSEDGINVHLEMLKVFTEISEFAGELDNIEKSVEKLYDKLIEFMPLPSSDENDEIAAGTEEPKLQFSHVECLMFAFHQFGRRVPGFLTDEENSERLKDFRLRLQYFARGVQVYIKQLRTALQGKSGDDLKTEENKIKIMALKITSNINILIKDLFHNPPSYKSTVSLSWKPFVAKAAASPETTSAGQKRTTITFESSNGASAKKIGKQQQTRQLYAPPSGKFSNKAGTYSGPVRGGGRGGRGRGFRGWRGGYDRY